MISLLNEVEASSDHARDTLGEETLPEVPHHPALWQRHGYL
jgi:hypothetical protein